MMPAVDLSDIATRINAEHEHVRKALTRGVGHAIEAGRLLVEAKAALPHGDWLPWLREHCTVSERAAQMYMRLAREIPHLDEAKAQRVADLSLRGAVRLLGAPRCEPEPGAVTLKLPDRDVGVRLTVTGAEFFGDPTRDEWLQLGQAIHDLITQNGLVRPGRNKAAREEAATTALALQEMQTFINERPSCGVFTPPAGASLVGRVGEWEAYIMPSVHEGFFYVAVLYGRPDGGAFAEGTKKPVRHDALEQALTFLHFPVDARVDWKTESSRPWDYNPWLFNSHQDYVDRAILRRGGAA